jgi:hypothetical protein
MITFETNDRAESELSGRDVLLQLRANEERVPAEPGEVREDAETMNAGDISEADRRPLQPPV